MRTIDYDYPEPCDRCEDRLAVTVRKDEALCASCAHIIDTARMIDRLADEMRADIEAAQYDARYS